MTISPKGVVVRLEKKSVTLKGPKQQLFEASTQAKFAGEKATTQAIERPARL